ncbi:winged helix-turn-helix transcriptional regulator [Sorangium sp. So ce1099]|uniref:winged helix-turn-helix transcriptional regulator n=1 Tax=Sorangium sp. So ce1099 TaxID=3133331 RepID=UPI003F5E817E
MKPSCQHLCEAFQAAMDVLAKPWSGLIIATLEGGALRFGEIGGRLAAISDRMLSSRLKELEALGLVVRRVLPGPPVRVEYELTDTGRGFGEVAQAITRWGEMLAESAARGVEARGVEARGVVKSGPRVARKELATKRARARSAQARVTRVTKGSG